MGALFSVATFCCVWLFNKPHKVEMESMRHNWEIEVRALRGSLDKVSEGFNKLSDELQASREDRAAMNEKIKTLFVELKEVKQETETLRTTMIECRRGDTTCSKK